MDFSRHLSQSSRFIHLSKTKMNKQITKGGIMHSMLISKEKDESNQYRFAVDDDGLVKLLAENVYKAEAMVANNSAYRNATNSRKGPIKDYLGSTAYWMTGLKDYFFDKKKIHISEELKKIANKELPETDRRFLCYLFYFAVRAVNRENSTHIESDGYGFGELSSRLFHKYQR